MTDMNTIAAVVGAAAAVTGLVGGGIVTVNVLFVRYVVRDEIMKINGRYVYSSGSDITGAEIQRRLEALES